MKKKLKLFFKFLLKKHLKLYFFYFTYLKIFFNSKNGQKQILNENVYQAYFDAKKIKR